MLENAEAVVEKLIAGLRDGHRGPGLVSEALAGLGPHDADALEQVRQMLQACNRAGRISDQDLEALCRMLVLYSRSTSVDDHEATVELELTTPLSQQPEDAAPAARPVELRRGSVLRDRYVLGEPVGRGGMSVVFRARDLRREASDDGEPPEVAVKLLRQELRTSAAANARLKREFAQTQALRHPGVVRVFDLDCDGDTWFITMELLVGSSLDARSRKPSATPLDKAEALATVSACAQVLAFAHRQGLVHGDFKPGNVFLTADGAVKLLDFGTAPESPQAVDGTDERSAIPRAATRAYASPEILAGEAAEPRDDIFSLACVAYELLAGRHPFGRFPANKARDLALVVTSVPGLTPAQNVALARGLAWARAERPATVQKFIRALTTPAADTVRPWIATGSQTDRRPWRMLGVLAAATVVLAALWQIFAGAGREGRSGPADVTSAVSSSVRTDAPVETQPPALSAAPVQAAPADGSPASSAAVEQPVARRRVASSAVTAAAPARAQVGVENTSMVVSEGTSSAAVLLRRQGRLDSTVQVAWRLLDGSARLQDDFGGPMSGTARFLPGQTTRAIYVPITDDTVAEGDEFFSLRLSSRSADIGPVGHVAITIVDDDR